MPQVSVTMRVYNAASYLADAIQSVLEQTYTDFELIIVDDGSTDATWDILSTVKDDRIITIKREHDYIASLNCAMQMARGKYIARMDPDDLMHPERLAIQIAMLECAPEVDICLSWMQGFNNKGENCYFTGEKGWVTEPLLKLLTQNPFYHPTAMIRRDFWKAKALNYTKAYVYTEDYKLWSDCAQLGAIFYVIPQMLHYYRTSETQVTTKHNARLNDMAHKVQIEIAQHICRKAEQTHMTNSIFEGLLSLKEKQILTHREVIDIVHTIGSRTLD